MFEAMPRTYGGTASRNQKGLAGKAEPFRTVLRRSRELETISNIHPEVDGAASASQEHSSSRE